MDSIKRFSWQSTITLSLIFALLAFILGQQLTSASVSLIYFEGDGSSNSQVNLEWETGSEVDTVGFTIERSTEPEGVFDSIPMLSNGSETSFVPSVGSAALGNVYSIVDENVTANTTYYYRLIEYVENGSSSDIASVEVDVGSPTPPTSTPTDVPIVTIPPTATSTLFPTKTNTPIATNTPQPTNTSTPTQTATNTPVPTNTATPTITNTPIPDATFTPTATATERPTRTPIPTLTFTPTAVPTTVPGETAVPTQPPTETPRPTRTPRPTTTPNPLIPATATLRATATQITQIELPTPTAIFGTATPTVSSELPVVTIADEATPTEPSRNGGRRPTRTPFPPTSSSNEDEEETDSVAPPTAVQIVVEEEDEDDEEAQIEVVVDVDEEEEDEEAQTDVVLDVEDDEEEDDDDETIQSEIILLVPTTTPQALAESVPTTVIEDTVVVPPSLADEIEEEDGVENQDAANTTPTPIFPTQNPTFNTEDITREPTLIESQPTGGNAVVAQPTLSRENNGISNGVSFDTNSQSQNTVQANAASQRSKFMLLWLGFIMSMLLFVGTAVASIYLFMRRKY